MGYSQLNHYRNVYDNRTSKEESAFQNENKKVVTKNPNDEERVLNIVKNQTGLTGIKIASLEVKIKDFVKTYPGSKARKIASALGIEKKDANHILYNNLKNVCISDSKFNWYLKDDLNNKKGSKRQNIHFLLEKATKEHIAVYINYKGYWRVIHPYSVNSTYCVGFCTYRNDLRTFRIDRIREAILKDSFQPKSRYSNQASKKVDEAKYYRKY